MGAEFGHIPMGLKKLTGKLAEYRHRLEQGEADEIKPAHVEKVLAKLETKRTELEARLAGETDPKQRDRLNGKLALAREQIARARWLLLQLG